MPDPQQSGQVGQLPIDAAKAVQLMQLAGGAGMTSPNVPTTGTTQLPALSNLDAQLQQQIAKGGALGIQQEPQAVAAGQAQSAKNAPLLAQQAALAANPPKFGFQAHMEHGQGAPGFLHNLGQVLTLIGAATAPGRSIEGAVYGPRVASWQQKLKALNEAIGAGQTQQQLEQQPIASEAGLIYHPMMAGAEGMRGEGALAQAQARLQEVANERWRDIGMLLQNEQKLGIEQTTNLVRSQVAQIAAQAREYAADRGLDAAQVLAGVRQQLGNLAAKSDVQKLHPWLTLQQIDQWLGMEAPEAPQIPGTNVTPTGSPVIPSGKAASGKGKGNMIYARDPNGVLHQAAPGTTLPKGWKLENKP